MIIIIIIIIIIIMKVGLRGKADPLRILLEHEGKGDTSCS